MANIILTYKIANNPIGDLIKILENRKNNGINCVLLKTWHRLDDQLTKKPDPCEHESVSLCNMLKVPIIWCRWLWPGYGVFVRENIYDSNWYKEELLALEEEQNRTKSKWSAFDVEVYGSNILTEEKMYVHTDIGEAECIKIGAAVEKASKDVGTCDYTWPAAYKSFQFVEPFNKFLGKRTIGQQMYNLPWKRLTTMPSDIFMAITGKVEPVNSPKFDTLELLTKYRGLWEKCQGVVLYPDGNEDWDLTAKALIEMK